SVRTATCTGPGNGGPDERARDRDPAGLESGREEEPSAGRGQATREGAQSPGDGAAAVNRPRTREGSMVPRMTPRQPRRCKRCTKTAFELDGVDPTRNGHAFYRWRCTSCGHIRTLHLLVRRTSVTTRRTR